MRLKQPMIAELDRNEFARILQDNHSSCKILQDSHFLHESWKILQGNHPVLTRDDSLKSKVNLIKKSRKLRQKNRNQRKEDVNKM